MRSLQVIGLISILLGLTILFLLRGPLYALIVVVLQLIGIFVGFLLIVFGAVVIFGWRWGKRGVPGGKA